MRFQREQQSIYEKFLRNYVVRIDLNEVEYFLVREADPNEVIKHIPYKSPLSLATKIGDYELCELLISYGAEVDTDTSISPLSAAVEWKRIDLVEKYASLVEDIDVWCDGYLFPSYTFEKGSPLHLAVRIDDAYIVEVLLKNGADPNLPTSYDCKIINEAKNWRMKELLELYGANNNHDRCFHKSGLCTHCKYSYEGK